MLKRGLIGLCLITAIMFGSTGMNSNASTVIESSGMGNDGQGGTISYTVGFNGNSTGKVYAGIRNKLETSKNFHYSYASGRGKFTAAVSYAITKYYCADKHGIIR